MSTIIRFFTLLTIAAAGFALPLNCAQGVSAADPVSITIPAVQQLDVANDTQGDPSGADTSQSLAQQFLDGFPLDCGESATPRAAEQPATFDTQPYVPGYMVSTIQLTEQSTDYYVPPPALIPIESRAGPPDAPPPKSID